MEFLILYLTFSLAIGICTGIFILPKVLASLASTNSAIQYKFVTYFTIVIASSIMAPVMVFPLIYAEHEHIFVNCLIEAFEEV